MVLKYCVTGNFMKIFTGSETHVHTNRYQAAYSPPWPGYETKAEIPLISLKDLGGQT